MTASDPVRPSGWLTEHDVFLFSEGTLYRAYERLGCHLGRAFGEDGAHFAVWAPGAERVAVIGSFDGWSDAAARPLRPVGKSGLWETFVPGVRRGDRYKFRVHSRYRGYRVDKTDPYGFFHEVPPATASVAWDLTHEWGDGAWMSERAHRQRLDAPMSVYEVHLGSWRRDGTRTLGYREIAARLAEYVAANGFTHVELLPITEHPYYGSWGYQTTGMFAPTSRYGTPQDLMYLIDVLHRTGIGVILDWVPAHFPSDEHGVVYFDGTHLYEHADPRQGSHPDWGTRIYNYNVGGVLSYLISSALFWLDRYHVDGLRIDAVASMLYLDYSRRDGEWVANRFGGKENLEAIEFLRRLNTAVHEHVPGAATIAEESTAWPLVSRPVYVGGLGFDLKWDMGWMHDTLEVMALDPVHRKFHHHRLTFRQMYAYNEHFVLALSHDEVVHGKRSLLGKTTGDAWRRFADLRLLFGYMWALPGKKLLFMGGEFGQWREWDHESELDWPLLDFPAHEGIRRWIADLNALYRAEPSMHRLEMAPEGFRWIDCHDADHSVLSLLRLGGQDDAPIAAVCNFTPVPRRGYRVGVPIAGTWIELLNSDATAYGGSGLGNLGEVEARPEPAHGLPFSLDLTLPPLAAIFLRPLEVEES